MIFNTISWLLEYKKSFFIIIIIIITLIILLHQLILPYFSVFSGKYLLSSLKNVIVVSLRQIFGNFKKL